MTRLQSTPLRVLFSAIGMILVVATTATARAQPSPRAAGGVLDLQKWSTVGDEPVRLAGEWAFYANRLLPPSAFEQGVADEPSAWFSMPSVWNHFLIDGQPLPGSGTGTFRLTILLPPEKERVALLIPYAFTAYRLWVGGRSAAAAGIVGPTAEAMTPGYRTQVVFINPPADGRITLTLQISNFMHAKGGMRDPIRLVAAKHVSRIKYRGVVKDVLVFGCLWIMAIYHLVLFAMRPVERYNLYFALICLLFGMRAGLTGELFLLEVFNGLDWQVTIRLEWLCVYTGGPLGIGFVCALFPRESKRWIYRGALIVGGIMALIVLFTPSLVFTAFFPYITPLIVLMTAYAVWLLAKATRKRRHGAGVILLSTVVVFATVINDILYANDLIETGHYIPYGLIVFVLSQAVILAKRSATAYSRLEQTNVDYVEEIRKRKQAEAELKAYQDRLENLVHFRTEALADANQRLSKELDDRKRAEAETLRLQEQLQRAQKMEALGTLAGGVAHDLNNILAGVVGYPDLLLHDLPENSPLRRPLQTIGQSGQKAATIVQDLLTLARRGVAEFKVIDMNRVVSGYVDSPEYRKLIQFHPQVKLKTDLAADLLGVKGSIVHLEKTVMNLVSNAAEAMPGGGTIHVVTANATVTTPTGDFERLPPGQYVVLRVTDNGIGISPEDIQCIFEPFYTKKVMGKSGTGLGMAVVWGTVKDHGGYIDVQSQEGEGTAFAIHFPATTAPMEDETDGWSPGDHLGKGLTVLVVDDVPEQRDIGTAMLRKLGYHAVAVPSGEDAVARLADDPVDLLLLDMIMDPGIDGLETYRRIVARWPGQRAIITTGYTETDRVRQAQRLGPVVYLKKPYRLDGLTRALQTVLADPA